MATSPNNDPSFRSARALIFPDGTLTPEGLEAVKRKPDDMTEILEAQNRRIAELLAEVKKLESENKESKKALREMPFYVKLD